MLDLDIPEALLRGESGTRVDGQNLVAERPSHGNQRLRHMHGADDDEARGRGEDVDEDFAVASRHGHALVLAEGLGEGRRQIVPEIARRMGKPPSAVSEICYQRRLASRLDVAGELMQHACSFARSSFHRLDEDADGATTGEPGLPGGAVFDAEFERLWLGGEKNLCRLGDHLALHAATRDRAEEIPSPVDRKLAADRPWRRAPGLNDSGKGDAAAFFQPVERAWNDAWIAGTHRLFRNSGSRQFSH